MRSSSKAGREDKTAKLREIQKKKNIFSNWKTLKMKFSFQKYANVAIEQI